MERHRVVDHPDADSEADNSGTEDPSWHRCLWRRSAGDDSSSDKETITNDEEDSVWTSIN